MKPEYMDAAIQEAFDGIHSNHGGPFGCVIVKNGKIIGRGHNRVLIDHDPTAHGEVTAIRDAGRNLGTHDLSGCEMYTTGEPCPMCLAATMWANIGKVYYGCTIEENSIIGFRDAEMDEIVGDRKKTGNMLEQLGHDKCVVLFHEYNEMNAQRY